MPFVAAPILLPEPLRVILSQYSHSRSLPLRQVERAKIIVLAADGLNNMQISEQVSLNQDSVSKWRHRFIKECPFFQELTVKNPAELENAAKAFLMDLPRPGQPRIYTDEQMIKILEIACHPPADHGYELSHWTLTALADVAIKEGIVKYISAKTVSRFLKYGENPPTSCPVLVAFVRENRFTRDFCRKSQ